MAGGPGAPPTGGKSRGRNMLQMLKNNDQKTPRRPPSSANRSNSSMPPAQPSTGKRQRPDDHLLSNASPPYKAQRLAELDKRRSSGEHFNHHQDGITPRPDHPHHQEYARPPFTNRTSGGGEADHRHTHTHTHTKLSSPRPSSTYRRAPPSSPQPLPHPQPQYANNNFKSAQFRSKQCGQQKQQTQSQLLARRKIPSLGGAGNGDGEDDTSTERAHNGYTNQNHKYTSSSRMFDVGFSGYRRSGRLQSIPSRDYSFSRKQYGTGTGAGTTNNSNNQFVVPPALPGMINVGNTCYLNAILQSLFSLPSFNTSVRAAIRRCGAALRENGVLNTMLMSMDDRLNSIERRKDAKNTHAEDAAVHTSISPEALKNAVSARVPFFNNDYQQDAHEFFVALLDACQEEVLEVEAARVGRHKIRVSETSDPGTRVFGMAIEKQYTCAQCQHVTSKVEHHTHLSLNLPDHHHHTNTHAHAQEVMVPQGLNAMLSGYFSDHPVDKDCEHCGAKNERHNERLRIKRLPHIMVLHVKRFKVLQDGRGEYENVKVCEPVSIAHALRIKPFCVSEQAGLQRPLTVGGGVGGGAPTGVAGLDKENETDPSIIKNNKSNKSAVPQPQRPTSPHLVRPLESRRFYDGSGVAGGQEGEFPKVFGRKSALKKQGAGIAGYWDNGSGGGDGGGEHPPTLADTFSGIVSGAAGLAENTNDDSQFKKAIEESKKEEEARRQAEEKELEDALKKSMEKEEGGGGGGGDAFGGDENRTNSIVNVLVEDDEPLGEDGCGGGGGIGGTKTKSTIKVQNNNGNGSSDTLQAPIVLANYRLTAVICHHGRYSNSGHYTADACDLTTGEWHRFNDSQVYRISGDAPTNEQRQTDCYMLMYTLGT